MSKIVTFEQLQQHKQKDNLWVLLDGKVYDVSKFLDEHPGGDEVILAEAGKDATEAFEDVGHSDEARALLKDMLVGEFEKDGILKAKSASSTQPSASGVQASQGSSAVTYLLPLAFLGAYFAWRFYA